MAAGGGERRDEERKGKEGREGGREEDAPGLTRGAARLEMLAWDGGSRRDLTPWDREKHQRG